MTQGKASGIFTEWLDEKVPKENLMQGQRGRAGTRGPAGRQVHGEGEDSRYTGTAGTAGTAGTWGRRRHYMGKRNFRLGFPNPRAHCCKTRGAPFPQESQKGSMPQQDQVTSTNHGTRPHIQRQHPLLIFSNKAYHPQSLSDPPHSQEPGISLQATSRELKPNLKTSSFLDV